jgi:hypothetical protein
MGPSSRTASCCDVVGEVVGLFAVKRSQVVLKNVSDIE